MSVVASSAKPETPVPVERLRYALGDQQSNDLISTNARRGARRSTEQRLDQHKCAARQRVPAMVSVVSQNAGGDPGEYGTRGATPMQGCYLLHFERVVHGAQHYLGWSVDIARRVRTHLNGRGARLVRQALRAGVVVELVRVWPSADRKQERLMKKGRAPKRYCPKCGIRARRVRPGTP
jgi:predicted GIY-YIG superfamily endonuclease